MNTSKMQILFQRPIVIKLCTKIAAMFAVSFQNGGRSRSNIFPRRVTNYDTIEQNLKWLQHGAKRISVPKCLQNLISIWLSLIDKVRIQKFAV